jgi:hypothetical protein
LYSLVRAGNGPLLAPDDYAVAEMEGQVLFAKLGNSTGRLGTRCENSLALLGPRLGEHVTAIF